MRPKVALAIPSYDGTVRLASARASMISASLPKLDSKGEVIGLPDCEICTIMDCATSILPLTFNTLFSQALGDRDAGDVTHFAMLHGDIRAAHGWLDLLWREMQLVGADAISAVVPIKEPVDNPPTSTAVGSIADPWKRPTKYRLDDRDRLPITFGQTEVTQEHGDDAVLLINTGCMLLDIRNADLWDGFAFQFHDRIARNTDGTYIAQTRPEDWEMSRFLHERGAKVFATWAVPLEHIGTAAWSCGPSKNHQ